MLLEKRQGRGDSWDGLLGWFGTKGSKPTGEILKAGMGTAGVAAGHNSRHVVVTECMAAPPGSCWGLRTESEQTGAQPVAAEGW